MPPPVLFRHPSSLLHDPGPHPERPARIEAIDAALAAQGDVGYRSVRAPAASATQLAAVHDPGYLRSLEAFCAAGGGPLDPDTIVVPDSWDAARHAAGGAVALVDALVGGEAPAGASLHRPPGHHALPARAMGFCLLASVAIAARHALDAHGLERVLVLDWDVHHGNGTHDIFYAEPRVLFCSLHQWPFWPGTGTADQTGAGPGIGRTMNLPLPARSGDALWTSMVEHVVVPVAERMQPQLILISAGYDAHEDDPLAGCAVTDAGFAAMAGSVAALGARSGAPVGLVLEGGYDLGVLERCVPQALAVLAGPPPVADVEEHPAAVQARQRFLPAGA